MREGQNYILNEKMKEFHKLVLSPLGYNCIVSSYLPVATYLKTKLNSVALVCK
jgi:hypothetical protein